MYTIASNGTEGASHIWGPLVHFGRRYAPAMPASSRRRWPRQMAKKASSVGCGACREGIEACAIEPESGDLALNPADDAEPASLRSRRRLGHGKHLQLRTSRPDAPRPDALTTHQISWCAGSL